MLSSPHKRACRSKHSSSKRSLKPSAIKPVIATLEQRLVIRQLGALSAEDQDALGFAIGQIIG
jgi:hypothetical protein